MPGEREIRPVVQVDPLRCTDRATIPPVEHVINARWSADSSALAVARVVTVPSHVTITGYEEESRISVLNIRTGAVRELGQGSRPEWSASGAYLSYWRDDGYLYVNLNGTIAAKIETSDPEVRWKGDDLYYWYADEIRVWHAGEVRTVSRVDPEFMIHYPHDDAYFSADAALFTLTRYSLDGTAERWVGETDTGQVEPLGEAGVTFSEWGPRGETLLTRSNTELVLRGTEGSRSVTPLSGFAGRVHGWTADGQLLIGAVSPTIPGGNAFDTLTVLDQLGEKTGVAILPNLFGTRSFSPDGSYFTGVSRTGLYTTALDLYRCGVAAPYAAVPRADPAARSRQARIDQDGRRFVRPVAGEITQFLQGAHTGVDIAAPFGSIIVAADDGVVDAAGWVQVGGRRVCVQHAGGVESCYYHTSAALVVIGEHVARGQPIALIGMTGATTGPHVHWEVKQDERIIDPLAH